MTQRGSRVRRFAIATGGALLLSALVWLIWPPGEPLAGAPLSTALYDRDGQLLGARIARDGQWRFPATAEVPDKLAQALIRFEDKRFLHHPGVDPLALARALRLNWRAGRSVSGGSTLTMQLVRLSRGNPPRRLGEKLIEALLALRLELHYSKSELLALYASHAPYGGNVVGAEAAAWRYFGRAPEQLSWAEAATLAVLPNSPALIHPGRGRERLQRKRDGLLARLQAEGRLSAMELQLALREPLPGSPRALPRAAPQLLDTLAARRDAPARLLSTLDGALQTDVERLLAARAAANGRQGVRHAAAVVLDNRSLETLAYVGNSPVLDADSEGAAVDLVQAERSTGSILKPFLFAAAVQDGRIQPSALVPDVPVRFKSFRPENFDRQFRGAVRASEALALSLNVPAVHLLRSYGQERFYDLLVRLGMGSLHRPPDDYGLSLILGGAEGRLWDMANLYAQLARISEAGQDRARSRFAFARLLRDQPAEAPRAADFGAGAAWLTLEALREVGRPEDEAHWKSFSSALPLAWKTGTSYGLRDGWALGVTPRHTIAVWVGNASGEGRAGLTGAAMAAPLLFDIAHRLGDQGRFTAPLANLRAITVCQDDGYLPSQGCDTESRRIPSDAHFETVSPWHQTVHLDPSGRWRVDSRCQPVDAMRHASWFVLPPVMEAYRRPHDSRYRPLPDWRPDCRDGGDSGRPFDLVYPQPGIAVFIPTDLGGKRSQVVLKAVHRDPAATLHWHLDGDYLASTQPPHQLALDLAPGVHELTLVDAEGGRLVRSFEVLGANDGKVRDRRPPAR